MTEAEEEAIYDAQSLWLQENYPNAKTNDGWFVDQVDGIVSTKVYGHGVLTTNTKLEHTFEDFS